MHVQIVRVGIQKFSILQAGDADAVPVTDQLIPLLQLNPGGLPALRDIITAYLRLPCLIHMSVCDRIFGNAHADKLLHLQEHISLSVKNRGVLPVSQGELPLVVGRAEIGRIAVGDNLLPLQIHGAVQSVPKGHNDASRRVSVHKLQTGLVRPDDPHCLFSLRLLLARGILCGAVPAALPVSVILLYRSQNLRNLFLQL